MNWALVPNISNRATGRILAQQRDLLFVHELDIAALAVVTEVGEQGRIDAILQIMEGR